MNRINQFRCRRISFAALNAIEHRWCQELELSPCPLLNDFGQNPCNGTIRERLDTFVSEVIHSIYGVNKCSDLYTVPVFGYAYKIIARLIIEGREKFHSTDMREIVKHFVDDSPDNRESACLRYVFDNLMETRRLTRYVDTEQMFHLPTEDFVDDFLPFQPTESVISVRNWVIPGQNLRLGLYICVTCDHLEDPIFSRWLNLIKTIGFHVPDDLLNNDTFLVKLIQSGTHSTSLHCIFTYSGYFESTDPYEGYEECKIVVAQKLIYSYHGPITKFISDLLAFMFRKKPFPIPNVEQSMWLMRYGMTYKQLPRVCKKDERVILIVMNNYNLRDVSFIDLKEVEDVVRKRRASRFLRRSRRFLGYDVQEIFEGINKPGMRDNDFLYRVVVTLQNKSLLDKSIALHLVRGDGKFFKYLPKEFRECKEIVLAAVKQNGNAARFCDIDEDQEILCIAAKAGGLRTRIIGHDERIVDDKEIMLSVVKHAPKFFKYGTEYIRSVPEIVTAAIERNVDNLKYVSQDYRGPRRDC